MAAAKKVIKMGRSHECLDLTLLWLMTEILASITVISQELPVLLCCPLPSSLYFIGKLYPCIWFCLMVN